MKKVLLLLITLLSFSLLGAPAKTKKATAKKKPNLQEKAPELIAKFQEAWDKAATYQANFHQVITSIAVGTKDESNGTLYVVKPQKLRWETKTDNSIQILDGSKLTVIHENRRRKTRTVDIYSNVGKAVDNRALSFLSGKMRFADAYNILVLSDSAEKAELKLVPKDAGKDSSKESILAEIEKNRYLLRALTTESVDSRVRLEFTEIQTNVTLAPELFEFKPGPEDIVNEMK